MKKTNRYKALAIMMLAVSAGMALLLVLYTQQPDEAAAEDESNIKDGGEPEMIAARPGPVLESPLLNEDAEEAMKEIERGATMRKREDGVYTCIFFGNMEDPHTDIAMVELRFLKENEKGGPEKLHVEHVNAYQRVGQYTRDIDDKGWKPASHAGYHVEACALRLPAVPPGTEYRVLGFGRRYHLKYKAIDSESGDPVFFDSIIKVPEQISPGKMAVIEVLAKPELSGGFAIPRSPPEPDTRIRISGKITTPLPPTETEWMVAYNHPDTNGRVAPIGDDGSFDLGKREPAGMLHIAERGPQGVAWIIVDSVDKDSRLMLPRDADHVIARESLRDIDIVIPEEPDIDNFSGIWLVDDKDGLAPIATQTRPSKYEAEKFKQFHETATLRMKAPPGKYWVKAYYDPPREWKGLGWIRVPEKDGSGTLPQLQPVLD